MHSTLLLIFFSFMFSVSSECLAQTASKRNVPLVKKEIDFYQSSTVELQPKLVGRRMVVRSRFDKASAGICRNVNGEFLILENKQEHQYIPLAQIRSVVVIEQAARLPCWVEGVALVGALTGLVIQQHQSRPDEPNVGDQLHTLRSFLLAPGLGCAIGGIAGYYSRQMLAKQRFVEYTLTSDFPKLGEMPFDPEELLARLEKLGGRIGTRKDLLIKLLNRAKLVELHKRIGSRIDLKEHLDYHLYPETFDFAEAYIFCAQNGNTSPRYFSLVLRESGAIAVKQLSLDDINWMRAKIHDSENNQLAH